MAGELSFEKVPHENLVTKEAGAVDTMQVFEELCCTLQGKVPVLVRRVAELRVW